MAKKTAGAPRNQAAANARARAQAQVRTQERRALALIIGGSLVVVALFAGLVIFIMNESQVAEQSVAAADSNYGIPIGQDGVVGGDQPEGAVRLDIYADYRCGACASFEHAVGAEIDSLREEGLVALYVHPVAILGSNSVLSGAAAAAVADGAPELFNDFNYLLFVRQPGQGQSWSAGQLADLATDLGVSDEVAEHIRKGAYATWVRESTEQASRDGLAFTPTVMVDGQILDQRQVDYFDPAALRAYVESVGAQS